MSNEKLLRIDMMSPQKKHSPPSSAASSPSGTGTETCMLREGIGEVEEAAEFAIAARQSMIARIKTKEIDLQMFRAKELIHIPLDNKQFQNQRAETEATDQPSASDRLSDRPTGRPTE